MSPRLASLCLPAWLLALALGAGFSSAASEPGRSSGPVCLPVGAWLARKHCLSELTHSLSPLEKRCFCPHPGWALWGVCSGVGAGLQGDSSTPFLPEGP